MTFAGVLIGMAVCAGSLYVGRRFSILLGLLIAVVAGAGSVAMAYLLMTPADAIVWMRGYGLGAALSLVLGWRIFRAADKARLSSTGG